MKRVITILGSLLFVFFLACEDYSATEVEVRGFGLVSLTAAGGTSITAGFTFDCSGDAMVVWWGDADSDYDKYLELTSQSNNDTNITETYPKGESFIDRSDWDNKTISTHTYPAPGNYDIVVIASSVGNFGEEVKKAITRKTIKIEM